MGGGGGGCDECCDGEVRGVDLGEQFDVNISVMEARTVVGEGVVGDRIGGPGMVG